MYKESFAELVQKYRKKDKLTIAALAKRALVSETAISLYEKPRYNKFPKFETLAKLALIFGLEGEERDSFFEAANISKFQASTLDFLRPKRGFKHVPILSSVQASRFSEVIATELDETTEYIPTDSNDPDVFALRVSGDCMEPEFRDGEIIVISPNAHVSSGDYVVAQCDNDKEATFKQYKIYRDSHWLKPVNIKYEEICMEEHRCRIIGRVIWSGRKR